MKKMFLLGIMLLLFPFVSAMLGDADYSNTISSIDEDTMNNIINGFPMGCSPIPDCSNLDFDGSGNIGGPDSDIMSWIINGFDMTGSLQKPTEIEILNITNSSFLIGIKNEYDGYINGMEIEMIINNVTLIQLNQFTNPYITYEYKIDDYYFDNFTIEIRTLEQELNPLTKIESINMTTDYNVVWTNISETECSPEGTKVVTYNDTTPLGGILGFKDNIENCDYVAPQVPSDTGSSGGGGGGGSSADSHPALVTPITQETRTLEQPEQKQEEPKTETPSEVTGAAVAETNTGNYVIAGILVLVVIVVGFFAWKKYK